MNFPQKEVPNTITVRDIMKIFLSDGKVFENLTLSCSLEPNF